MMIPVLFTLNVILRSNKDQFYSLWFDSIMVEPAKGRRSSVSNLFMFFFVINSEQTYI